MTTKRRPTLKQCVVGTLRKYRAALKAAEGGNWKRADKLTNMGTQPGTGCLFCRRNQGVDGLNCHDCEARHICHERHPYENALQVMWGNRTPEDGRHLFEYTIEQLEALKS